MITSSLPHQENNAPSCTGSAPNRPAEIRLAAMNLLARREHGLGELRIKLLKRFDDEAQVEAQLQRLAQENLQSDARFAESFVRMRAGRGHGPARVRRELQQKQLSGDDIDSAFVAADIDWGDLAEKVYLKKFGVAAPTDMKEKSRRRRFMEYRGFCVEQYEHLIWS